MEKTSFTGSISSFSALEDALLIRERYRREKKRLVLTNGCFDLLHPGHIHSLNVAASYGDYLWVALNSDKSVKALKGPSRPIINENYRAFSLNSLKAVSLVFLFDGQNLSKEILAISPDVYVKSSDYSLETLDKDEKESLTEVGAEISFIPLVKGFSTSALVSKIRS